MITLSFDLKISAVYSVVSSQSTPVTDRHTDRQRDGQIYDPQDRASIAASRGLSVICVLSDETIERTADILTPYARVIILVFY